MSRLTEKLDDGHLMTAHHKDGHYRPAGFHTSIQCYEKLGKLEDIEEDILCPIETVFKALSDGVYAKIPDITNGIEFFKELRLGRVIGGQWRLIVLREGKGNNFPLYLGCLGKTWALTKEELQ